MTFLISSIKDVYDWSNDKKWFASGKSRYWLSGPGTWVEKFSSYRHSKRVFLELAVFQSNNLQYLPSSYHPMKETEVKSNVESDRTPCVKPDDQRRVILSKRHFWDREQRFRSWIRFLSLTSPMLTQVADSLTDGLYFVNLRLKPRLVHVPSWVHVVQGILLFTREYNDQVSDLKHPSIHP